MFEDLDSAAYTPFHPLHTTTWVGSTAPILHLVLTAPPPTPLANRTPTIQPHRTVRTLTTNALQPVAAPSEVSEKKKSRSTISAGHMSPPRAPLRAAGEPVAAVPRERDLVQDTLTG